MKDFEFHRPSTVPEAVALLKHKPDAKLLSEAVKTANATPDIRADVVEQMKQKLAAGEVGNDSGRLADSMLDSILKK